MRDDTALFFECTLGEKSHINLVGKIIFSPLILSVGLLWIIMDFLFLKKPHNQ